MDSDSLDRLLDDLERNMPSGPGFFYEGGSREDWQATWDLAKQIQEAFRGVRYPSKDLREQAWKRFNALRDEATKRRNAQRDKLRSSSAKHLSHILYECKGLGYSKLADDILFFYDKTTTEQMKARGRYLGAVMRYLSEHKHDMLSEHKKEAFERIQEVKEEHDLFWQRHHEAHKYKAEDRLRRVEANVAKNHGMLENARSALDRAKDRAAELQSQIDEGSSDKWIRIWGEWLSETEAKIADIEAHIHRIEGWIDEGEEELRKLR